MTSKIDIIERKYNDFKEIIDYLEKNKEISLKNIADNDLKKNLLLSAASYFEDLIKEIILNFVENNSNKQIIKSFVKNKAVERQYHTYFDWKAKNANRFFSLFGEEFKMQAEIDIKNDINLKKFIQDFLELGNLRNEIVHENFTVFPIEKTAEEIFELYCSAYQFIEYLSLKLK